MYNTIEAVIENGRITPKENVKLPKSGRVLLTFLKKGGTKSPNRKKLSAFFLLAGKSPVVSSEIYKLRKLSKI
jgi:hypothetical protein